MKCIVNVSHLQTEDKTYRRGEMIELPPEKIEALGTSVTKMASAPVAAIPEPMGTVGEPPGETRSSRRARTQG